MDELKFEIERLRGKLPYIAQKWKISQASNYTNKPKSLNSTYYNDASAPMDAFYKPISRIFKIDADAKK